MFVPFGGRNICHRVLLLKRKIIAQIAIQHIEINASSSATTVKLAKTKVISLLLTSAGSLLGPPLACHAVQKLGNSNMLCNTKNPVELNIVKCQVPIGSFI